MVCAIVRLWSGPVPSMPRITAKMIQPTRSLNTAAATTSIPRSLRYRFRSISVLAITGRAEIDRAVAMNRAKSRGSAPASIPISCGRNQAAAKPTAKGTRTPAKPTLMASRPCRQIVDRSTSSPATSRNRVMARVISPSIAKAPPPACGKRKALHAGARAPNTVGPSSMPARISPSTAG